MTQDLIKESKNKGFMSRNNLVQVNDDYYYLWMCELQKWLRDVHNLHIYIDTTPSFDSMETHRSKYKSHVKVPLVRLNGLLHIII